MRTSRSLASRLPAVLVLVVSLGAGRAEAQQTTPFYECGTLQSGPSSVLLAADGGGLFEVEQLGAFTPGARVFVQGELLWGCAPGVVGCVLWNSIRACGPTVGVAYCAGGVNSLGLQATIGAHGSNSVADGDLILVARNMHQNSLGLFFYGTSAVQVPFGAGFRCVGGQVQRMRPQLFMDINGMAGRAIDFSIDPALSDIALAAPVSMHFQLWYRDAGAANTTGGVRVDFVP